MDVDANADELHVLARAHWKTERAIISERAMTSSVGGGFRAFYGGY